MTELATNNTDFNGSGEYNALMFIIQNAVKGMVNTAIPVRVDSVTRPGEGGGAGYLSATPLVMMRGANGDSLAPVSIPRLRWLRIQHGAAAFICDPKPGDIGLAVFAQQDVSNLNGGNQPVPQGSFRCFDMSDGFYLGGFWGQKPTTFVHLEDAGQIRIVTTQSIESEAPQVSVECQSATVNASASVDVTTPQATVTGNVQINGNLNVSGPITGSGGLAVSGGSGAVVTGDVVADGISLKSHTHGCPQGGNTTPPNE